MCIASCKSTGASSDPPLMLIVLLSPRRLCHKRDPHTGQKAQSSQWPLSVGRDQNCGVPRVTLKVARGTTIEMPNAEADCFRHSVQWQTYFSRGPSATSYRT